MQELARFEQVQQARERERSRYYNHGKTTELGSGGVGLGGLQGDTDGDDVDRELDPIERMGVVGDDLTHWEVVITGPDETAYEGESLLYFPSLSGGHFLTRPFISFPQVVDGNWIFEYQSHTRTNRRR